MSKLSPSSFKMSKVESKKKITSTKAPSVNKLDSDVNIPITGSYPILQWPEWNDSEINVEKWDCKVADSRKKQGMQPPGPAASSTVSALVLFEDEPLLLPASWNVHAWKRPVELFTIDDEQDFVLYVERPEVSVHELVSLNQHIVHSEFVRHFLSAVLTVWHLGTNDSFPMEGESSTFVSRTKHLPWRPWHHVYSLCKAGKNFQHNPLINPSGKYIVRLYFMGCWRKITLDDKIPVDIDGNVLLPLTSEINELWPLLLAKAMLKLARLTWTNENELKEFNLVHCLTGWIVQECNTESMKTEDVWRVCNNFVKRFLDANEDTEVKDGSKILPVVKSSKLGRVRHSKNIVDKSSSKMFKQSREDKKLSKDKFFKGSMISSVKRSILKQSSGTGSKIKRASKVSAMTKSSKSDRFKSTSNYSSSKGRSRSRSDSSHPKSGKKSLLDENKHNTGPVLFGLMSKHWPMINVPEHFESPLTLSHPFLILQTRDTKFVCQKPRPGVPVWKQLRWIEWATKRGIFDPDMLLPFRSVQVVSLFNEWFDKIEEKDNPDAANRLSTEGIHASGDQGSSGHTHISLPHTTEKEEQNEHHTSKTSGDTAKPDARRVDADGGDGKRKESTKKGKCDSKLSFMSTRTRMSYLDTISSRHTSPNEKPAKHDEAAIQTCDSAVWTDFNHISSSVEKLLVFYKPSGFHYKINIANFTLNHETPVLRRKIGGDKKPLVDAIQSITIPFSIQRTRNDGVYLLLDSADQIKILFMLCTVPEDALQPLNNSMNGVSNDKRDPVIGTDASRFIPRKKVAPVNIVIEIYNWARREFNEAILVLETFGSKSAMLNLGEGRYILRVWIKTNTAFVLSCLSETVMIVGNRYNIDNVISSESERLKFFSQRIRNNLSYMFVTFGKPTFVKALHGTFQTINDFCTSQNKGYIHDVFMDAIAATVKHFMQEGKELEEYIFALRVFFLNVSLGLEKKVEPITVVLGTKTLMSYSDGESEEKQVIDYEKYSDGDFVTSLVMWLAEPSLEGRYRDAAYLIQASWKRYCVMKLMEVYRHTNSKEHKLVSERLKKLHERIFSNSTTYGDVILRILLTMLDLEPDIAKWLPLYQDLGFIVKVEEWRGVLVNITQNMWLPVVRMVVRCHSDTPMIGAVNVICQCAKYMVRVIDNDNHLEKPRQVFNVEPCMYTKNTHGYTVFVYAWSETPNKKEIQWKLEIVTLKNNPYLHSCTTQPKDKTCLVNKPPALMTLEVSNYYIPNHEKLMCRLLVTVKTKVLTSFRLTTSFRGVRFIMSLQDKDGFPLMCAEALEGVVIIPAAILEKENNSYETLYIIEAKVIADSWPLTREEWIVLERIKNEYNPHKERTVVYKSTSRLSLTTTPSKKLDQLKQQGEQKKSTQFVKKRKESRTGIQMQSPFWTLQTVIDYQQRDLIKVKQDNRREEAVKAMKQAWEAADPGRAKRGQQLREAFIKDVYGLEHDKTSSVRQLFLRGTLFRQQSESGTMTKDAEEVSKERFHNPPSEFAIAQSKAHFLHMISQYYLHSNDGEPKVKTREDHEREILERRKLEEELEQNRHDDLEERIRIHAEQKRKHRLMNEHYARARYESGLLLKAAYEMRDEFVRKRIEEEEDKKRLEAFMKKRRKKLSSKRSSKKSSRKSSSKKKDKKSSKTRSSSAKSLK